MRLADRDDAHRTHHELRHAGSQSAWAIGAFTPKLAVALELSRSGPWVDRAWIPP